MKIRSKLIVPIVAMAPLVLLLGACGSGGSKTTASATTPSASATTAAPATGTPIPIGTIEDETGSSTGETTIGTDTMKAWVDWTNAHGGIAGHPLKLYTANDNSDPAQAQSQLTSMIDDDHIVALVGQDATETQPTWTSLMAKAGVPVIGGPAYSLDYLTNPDFYSVTTTVQSAVWGGEYVVKQQGFKKEALLQCNNASVCLAAVPLVVGAAKQLGITLVYNQSTSELATSYTPQCLAMQSAGAQVVEPTVNNQLLAANCEAVGFKPVYVIADNDVTYAELKATPEFNGAIGFNDAFPDFQEFPQTQDYFTAMKQYEPAYLPGGSKYLAENSGLASSAAWAGGVVFGEAITNAAVPASQAVTAAEVKQGLAKIPQGSTNGGYTPPVFYGNGSTAPEKPVTCFWTDKVVNSQWQQIDGLKTSCEPAADLPG